MKKNVLILTVLLISASSIFGQNKKYDWSVGVHFGTQEYAGDLGNEFFSFSEQAAYGISATKYLTPFWDLSILATYGNIGHTDSLSAFDTKIFDLNGIAKLKFNNGKWLKEESKFAPYLFIGLGDAVSKIKTNGVSDNNIAFNFLGGLGFNIAFNERWGMDIMTKYSYAWTDKLDDRTIGNKFEDQYLTTMVGVKYNFTCKKDSDGDGVADKDDKCPNVKGAEANNGCPAEADEETKQAFKAAMEGLFFNSGSSVIKAESYPVLDNVVSVLNSHPKLKVNISGHTDNTGNAASNLQLSKDRAAAAKSYLIKKGVDASRLNSTGFGITQPRADNSTSEGRALNRRVEFNAIF